jgi:hypothetical protein
MIVSAISTAFFCWFFAYCLDEVPYLRWYGNLIDRLRCPFCMAPWLYILFLLTPSDANIIQHLWQVAFGFGWVYAGNEAFARYIYRGE